VTHPKISCDRCIDPGMCCRSFPLSHYFDFGVTPAKIMKWLAQNGLAMFRPLRRIHVWCSDHTGASGKKESGKWVEQWSFRCTALGEDGRCTIYDSRPDLCRTYEPGCDMMCVHMRGPDGRPVVPQRRK
jgi:Fe-S-cluster containining protein